MYAIWYIGKIMVFLESEKKRKIWKQRYLAASRSVEQPPLFPLLPIYRSFSLSLSLSLTINSNACCGLSLSLYHFEIFRSLSLFGFWNIALTKFGQIVINNQKFHSQRVQSARWGGESGILGVSGPRTAVSCFGLCQNAGKWEGEKLPDEQRKISFSSSICFYFFFFCTKVNCGQTQRMLN